MDVALFVSFQCGQHEAHVSRIVDMARVTRDLEQAGGAEFASKMLAMARAGMQEGERIALATGQTTIDPTAVITQAFDRYGEAGLKGMMALIELHNRSNTYSPYQAGRFSTWTNLQPLQDLFERSGTSPENGTFMDQRLIDYLSVNGEKLGEIHWRRFEELTAEYFVREGFSVELGAGSNDDGVDIRAWTDASGSGAGLQYLIQCKRQKAKIDKVTVKGLYADVVHAKADLGLLVTSSEFSPGARETVVARGYSVKEVNGDDVRTWLMALRSPGTGILRR